MISNTSVTVVESLYHNKPVLVYDNEMSNYPDSIVRTTKNKNHYSKNLKYMIDNSNNFQRENAIRWWSFKQGFGNLKLKYNFQFTFLFRATKKIITILNVDPIIILFNYIELKLYVLDKTSKSRLHDCIVKELDTLFDRRINENIKYLKND